MIEIIVVDNGSARLPERGLFWLGPMSGLSRSRSPAPGRRATAEFARRAARYWHLSMPIAGPIPGWLAAIEAAFADRTDDGSSAAMCGSDTMIRRGRRFSSHMKVSTPIATASTSRKGFPEPAILQRCRRSSPRSDPLRGSRLPRTAIGDCAPARQAMSIRYVPEMIVFHPARKTFAELTVEMGQAHRS